MMKKKTADKPFEVVSVRTVDGRDFTDAPVDRVKLEPSLEITFNQLINNDTYEEDDTYGKYKGFWLTRDETGDQGYTGERLINTVHEVVYDENDRPVSRITVDARDVPEYSYAPLKPNTTYYLAFDDNLSDIYGQTITGKKIYQFTTLNPDEQQVSTYKLTATGEASVVANEPTNLTVLAETVDYMDYGYDNAEIVFEKTAGPGDVTLSAGENSVVNSGLLPTEQPFALEANAHHEERLEATFSTEGEYTVHFKLQDVDTETVIAEADWIVSVGKKLEYSDYNITSTFNAADKVDVNKPLYGDLIITADPQKDMGRKAKLSFEKLSGNGEVTVTAGDLALVDSGDIWQEFVDLPADANLTEALSLEFNKEGEYSIRFYLTDDAGTVIAELELKFTVEKVIVPIELTNPLPAENLEVKAGDEVLIGFDGSADGNGYYRIILDTTAVLSEEVQVGSIDLQDIQEQWKPLEEAEQGLYRKIITIPEDLYADLRVEYRLEWQDQQATVLSPGIISILAPEPVGPDDPTPVWPVLPVDPENPGEVPEGYVTVSFVSGDAAAKLHGSTLYYVKIGEELTANYAPTIVSRNGRLTETYRYWTPSLPAKIDKDTIFTLRQGWEKNQAGEVRYYLDGDVLIGLHTIGKTTYLFNGQGVRQSGWHVVGGVVMYFDHDHGGRRTGLTKIGKTTYLLSAKKGKLCGWHKINGKEMYFDPNYGCGRVTGKRTIGQTTYLLTADGKLSGWHVLKGDKYYFDPNYGNGMVTGLRKVGSGTYFFRTRESRPGKNDRGAALCNGSVQIGDKVYYFNEKGLLVP